ncbi:MAG: FtsQ-type POTRA domain-containing protein [Acidobacteriota bacterium]
MIIKERNFLNGNPALFRDEFYYWRKKRNISVRKKRISRIIITKLFFLLTISAMASLLVFGTHSLYTLIKGWEKLGVKEIRIYTDKEDLIPVVESAIEEMKIKNILFLQLNDLKKRIEKMNWVKEAKIRRILPSTLEVSIVEKEPFCILKKEGYLLLNNEGAVLEQMENPEIFNLPIISGIKEDNFLDSLHFKVSFSALVEISKEKDIFKKIVYIDATNPNNLCIRLKDLKTLLYAGTENYVSKIKLFYEIEKGLVTNFGELEFVDLQIIGRIYIKKKG